MDELKVKEIVDYMVEHGFSVWRMILPRSRRCPMSG